LHICSRLIPHLHEHLFHVDQARLLVARAEMLIEQVSLPDGDPVEESFMSRTKARAAADASSIGFRP